MKQIFTVAVFGAILALFLMPSTSLAVANDTLVVYATPTDLNDVIMADTLAGGAFKHKVYKLVTLDTTYIFNNAITVRTDFTLLGVVDPTTKRPPCIQPIDPGSGVVPAILLNFVQSGTHGYVKNLYILSRSTLNTQNLPAACAIQVASDSIKLTVNNCVFEGWAEFAIGYSGNWDSFFIFNSKFRNMVHPNQWYVGEALRNLYPGSVYTDSIVMRYNTFFCLNGYAAAPVTKWYERYFEFTHNSIIYTFKNPFFIFNVTNGKINNNIFYAAWAGAISKTEYPWWDQLWSPEIGSIIDFDALDSTKAAYVLGHASTGYGDPAAEGMRTVEVKNNAYFSPTALTTYMTAWNDTAHSDSVYTPTWMNARTTTMFNNKTTWPGFVQSGNLNVDPGFGTSIQNVLTSAQSGATSSFLDWFKLCRAGTLTTTVWGLGVSAPNNTATWVPTWPLPEASAMVYSNVALQTGATDGIQIGDPNWFGVSTGVKESPKPVPTQFSLSEAYPNPFNPSTNIEYTLNKAGVTNLRVYNILGQVVSTLVDNVNQTAGTYKVTVDMSHVTSGVYFYVLEQGQNRIAHKMLLVK